MNLLKKHTIDQLSQVWEKLKKTFTPAMKLAMVATSAVLLDACQPVMPRPDGNATDIVVGDKNLDRDINNKVELAINIFNQNMPANINYAYPDSNGVCYVWDYEYGNFIVDIKKQSFSIPNPNPTSKNALVNFYVPRASIRELFTLAGRTRQVIAKYTGKSKLDGDEFKMFEKDIFGNLEFKDGKWYRTFTLWKDQMAWTLQKEWYPALMQENSDGETPVLSKYIKTLNGMGVWKEWIAISDAE